MPKGAGEWQADEGVSASKLNANDKLNMRNLRVGPGLGLQRNANSGDATLTLDPQANSWPVVRAKITQFPEDDSDTPLIAGVTRWDGTNFDGDQFYAKIKTLKAGEFESQPVDILLTRPNGGVPVNPQDGYDPSTGNLWASPLLDPDGQPVQWVQFGEIGNLFWGQMSGTGFIEVVSQTLSSGPYTGLDWLQLQGGRQGTVQNISGTPILTGVAYGPAPTTGVVLIFETYDIGVSPPTAVYYAIVGNSVVVEVTGNAPANHCYTGNIIAIGPGYGQYPTSQTGEPLLNTTGRACLIVNLEEVPLTQPGWKLGSGQYLHGTVASTGSAGGTTPAAPFLPVVCVNNGLVSNGASHTMIPGTDYWNNPGAVNAAGGWVDIVFSLSLISGKNYYTAVLGVDGGGILRSLTFTGAATPLPIPSGAVTGGSIVGGVLMLTTEP